MNVQTVTETEIWEVLDGVKDPEIPAVSVVEMGMVHKVTVEQDKVTVTMLPTFVGCPALEMIREEVAAVLQAAFKVAEVSVVFQYDPPWETSRMSEAGRKKLKQMGIAPPPEKPGEAVNCPYCNSPYTDLDNLFGPTACRSLLYCRSCRNPFEAFKPL